MNEKLKFTVLYGYSSSSMDNAIAELNRQIKNFNGQILESSSPALVIDSSPKINTFYYASVTIKFLQ